MNKDHDHGSHGTTKGKERAVVREEEATLPDQDEQLHAGIKRKTRELLDGFPLAGFTGSVDALRHLSAVEPELHTTFPPLSTSGRVDFERFRRAVPSTVPSAYRHVFDTVPELERYHQQMNNLFNARDNADGTPTVEFNALGQSAFKAFCDAVHSHGRDVDDIVWRSGPYPLPHDLPSWQFYKPFKPDALARVDTANSRTISSHILDNANFPFPSPKSTQQSAAAIPSLHSLPPASYSRDIHTATHLSVQALEMQRHQLLEAQANSRNFFKAFIDESTSSFPGAQGQRSPIPALGSSEHGVSPSSPTHFETPTSTLQPYAHHSSSSAMRNSLSPLRAREQAMYSQLLGSSSPDPMDLINSGPTGFHAADRSKSLSRKVGRVPVVEVQMSPAHRKGVLEAEHKFAALDVKQDPSSSEANNPPAANYGHRSESSYGADAFRITHGLHPSGFYSLNVAEAEDRDSGFDSKMSGTAKAHKIRSPEPTQGSTVNLPEKILQDFVTLVEDIFECEDEALTCVANNVDDEDEFKYRRHFHVTTHPDQVYLLAASSGQISTIVSQLSQIPGGGKTFGRKVETEMLARLLKILVRSAVRVQDMDFVPTSHMSKKGQNASSPLRTSPVRMTPRQPKSRSRSRGTSLDSAAATPDASARKRRRNPQSVEPGPQDGFDTEEYHSETSDGGDSMALSSPSKNTTRATKRKRGLAKTSSFTRVAHDYTDITQLEWTEERIQDCIFNLSLLKDAILAVGACINLLTISRLSKQLYSEDLINTCLNTLKIHLPALVYPAFDADNSTCMIPIQDTRILVILRDILQGSITILHRTSKMLYLQDMTDTIVINIIYVSIAPFFTAQSSKSTVKQPAIGMAEMKGVRNESLAVIRSVFARYPEQRAWIIEEILVSITKLPDLAKRKPQYLLATGQAIQMISVLLMHLVQSCASGVRSKVQAIYQNQDSAEGSQGEIRLGTLYLREIEEVANFAFESASRCCKAIIGYLLQRSGKATRNSTASEAEYKAVLEHLIKDLLVVAPLPDWPVATLMLQIAIKAMMAVLDDPKTSADVNTSKGICLDHLGVIGSAVYRLCRTQTAGEKQSDYLTVQSITQAVRGLDRRSLHRLAQLERETIQSLLNIAGSDEALEAAADYASMCWSADLFKAIKVLPTVQAEEETKPRFEQALLTELTELWALQASPPPTRAAAEEERKRLVQAASMLFPVHGLLLAMDAVLAHIVYACEGGVIAFRQKALKALSIIVEEETSIFYQDNVGRAVEKRLMDNSPAVRDAALEMLGRYVVSNPKLAVQYLPRIAERITDSGLSVRKRVIKLLRALYPIVPEKELQVDICRRLVGRVSDEDDSVKELAVSAVEEICFTPRTNTTWITEKEKQAAHTKDVSLRSSILMAVVGFFRDRPSPLEDVVRLIIDKYNTKTTKIVGKEAYLKLLAIMKDIVKTLVDSLVEAGEDSDFNVVNCTKTIYILLLADAKMLDVDKASALLPYLRSASTSEEQVIAEYLMRTFTAIVPHMASTASKFSRELQETLRGLLNKPAAVGNQALPELVACFCVVVTTQTMDYGKLCSAFKTCFVRLRDGVRKLTSAEHPPTLVERNQLMRSLPLLARLVSLFCQYGNFDRLRKVSSVAAMHIDAISRDSIDLQVYQQMVEVYHLTSGTPLHGSALQCLGYLYQVQPMFMLDNASTEIMDKIFSSATNDAKSILLRIFCDFLTSQSGKDPLNERDDFPVEVDVRQLIGNTANFADSGVSSAVVQRYLPHVLEAALASSTSQNLLRPALEVIGFTVKQGLAHPMQCLPVLVALETSSDQSIAKKAFALHSHLHNKHSALINTRISESIQTAFEYQCKIHLEGELRGYVDDPPSARLSRWYSLMKEKRNWRLDFLKAFIRGLHPETTGGLTIEKHDINLARFTAENLATLEYKTQEEVFFVIRALINILSVTGMQVYHQLQNTSVLHIREEATIPSNTPLPPDARHTTNLSIVLSFAFHLRAHLKALYGVTELKLSKYSIGKKSAVGDKAATMKANLALVPVFEDSPFAYRGVETFGDFEQQRLAVGRMGLRYALAKDSAEDILHSVHQPHRL